jgi:predicted RecB family nuclease
VKTVEETLILSATDLSIFLSCRHRTALDLSVALGEREKPTWVDPFAEVLRERGREHERKYVESLRVSGLIVVDLAGTDNAHRLTIEAMRAGAGAIVQACLRNDKWLGYADILQRVEVPSALGAWSYEVYDTKLARQTKAGTILQLAVYSDLLGDLQGLRPAHFHVVTPDPVNPLQRYRLADYEAYFRQIRWELEGQVVHDERVTASITYPEPVEHCQVCRWFMHCEAQRRGDDHLSYVAGMSRLHRRELHAHGITTLTELARMPVPLTFKPSRGSKSTFERLQDQARLQDLSRQTRRPECSLLLPPGLEQGLCRLPEPSEGDVFLDIEGDPFAREGGREYLFGIRAKGARGATGSTLPLLAIAEAADEAAFDYSAHWAFDDREERAAFEAVVDRIGERLVADPHMHVYHFGHYEPSALKRLMGRYASREDAIDRLLRAERFVDLHQVVRHAVRAGVESYSIKQLERLYDFVRDVPLGEAAFHRRTLEIALETHAIRAVGDAVRETVERYNRDDCRSTLALREWLESLRARVIGDGHAIARPTTKPPEPPQRVSDLQTRVEALRARLVADVPEDALQRTDAQHTQWLLAYLLDWHRREDKVAWWEYYRLRDLPEEDLFDEPQAITGLEFVGRLGDVLNRKTGRPTGTIIDRYGYPPQEMEIREDDELKLKDESKFGDVDDVDRGQRVVDVRKSRGVADKHPSAVFAHRHFPTDTMQNALLRLAERVTETTEGCGIDLLYRRPPRLASGEFVRRTEETSLQFAIRCGLDLDGSALAIQGPPGSGKTFTGARMICQLVQAGQRVGVTAVSHKVIRNLLDAVRREAAALDISVRCGHKTKPHENDPQALRVVESSSDALDLLSNAEVEVLGGTAWLWARSDAADAVDVLFVDEAGQMSLANVLAASQAARNLVLLGDPQQLEQPQKGSHPDGVDVSALDHVLGGAHTMPDDRGIFLPVTWRLAPALCEFTSSVFYDGRLTPLEGLEHQRLLGTGAYDEPGLYLTLVDHDRNRNWSEEEIEVIDRIVTRLMNPDVAWMDRAQTARRIESTDILVVAPYNAQVSRLADRLATWGVPVGTVDKFQGQEAPVVIYSMATSRPEDAPRGMEFLYSLNRLNVATSRARCVVILVASPALFEPECRTPSQMRLANALCRYRELARVVRPD